MRSLDGQLKKMPFGEIFQTISLCRQTGVLTLTGTKETAKLVFSQGSLFYASCDSMSPFGHTLMKKGIITSEELEDALAVQRSDDKDVPIADILERTGIVAKDVLQVELKKHFVSVVRTLLSWEEGSFHFDFGLRVEKGIILEEGLNLPSLLIEATRPADSWRLDLQTDISESPAEREEWALFTSMVTELLGSMSTNEVLLLFFRYASEVLNRCVVFLVKKKELVGMGQSGLRFRNEDADERIKKVRIPLLDPSVFRDVIDRTGSYKGPLSDGLSHKQFISQIGGDWPTEIFVAPLFDGRSTVALLYGDNLPDQTPLPDTRGLEAFVKIAGMAHAKVTLEKKLAERKWGAVGGGATAPSE
ncbi:MAG: DUF4388 domain-containing protein [Nitrospirae bacterium]|nr:DUF4388 domain-containing protein [Candidatus Troglogloeales bacterium]